MPPTNQHLTVFSSKLHVLILCTSVIALYGHFLSNPLVFDDYTFFGWTGDDPITVVEFGLRWLSISTFNGVRELFGSNLVWQRVLNLAIHLANVTLLYFLLLELFNASIATKPYQVNSVFAFVATLCFALHPVSVYAVAYLAQRTLLLATMFALLTWLLFLHGVLRERGGFQIASCATYILAVLSKEHAIMVPGLLIVLLLLVRTPSKQLFVKIGPVMICHAAIALFTYVQVKTGGIVGSAYEPDASSLLDELSVDPLQAYALSIWTQCALYFKYIALWVIPYPGWMSVDMLEPFARNFWSMPRIFLVFGFFVYPVVCTLLLLRRRSLGLLGFALLGPWVLFATELSAVRVQETFVLYRSYLWMPCLFAVVPLVLLKVNVRIAVLICMTVAIALASASWNRLTSFSASVLLWDDALSLAQGGEQSSRLGRMHYNRGVAHLTAQRFTQAIEDFDAGAKYLPNVSLVFNDRAMAYLGLGHYEQALQDFNEAVILDPNYYDPYLGRAQVYEALGNFSAARWDYARACGIGLESACAKL